MAALMLRLGFPQIRIETPILLSRFPRAKTCRYFMDPREEVMHHFRDLAPLEQDLSGRACTFLLQKFPHGFQVGLNYVYHGGGGDGGCGDGDGDGIDTTKPNPEARIVLTAAAFENDTWTSSSDLCFVCFIGFIRDGPDMAGPDRWKSDENMCAELQTMSPTVYTYISVPANTANGDWFNLVLFKNPKFLHAFEKSKFHRDAIEVLSPASFTDVCVRSGRWKGGVGPGGTAIVEKTVMLSYQNASEVEQDEGIADVSGTHILRGGFRVRRNVYRAEPAPRL